MTSILNRAKSVTKNSPLSWHTPLFALSIISSLSLATPSVAASVKIADFDSLPEGFSDTTITDGGITFSNLIAGFRIGPPNFVVASSNQLDPFFSPPNYLTFGGLSSNPSIPDFGAFGSLTISSGHKARSASIDIFSSTSSTGSTIFEQPDATIVLEAFRKGQSVASTSISFSEFTAFGPADRLLYANLSLSGVKFDELQLYTPNAFADGVVFIGIDNVTIKTKAAPEPLTVLGTITASSLGLLFKKQASKQKKQKDRS